MSALNFGLARPPAARGGGLPDPYFVRVTFREEDGEVHEPPHPFHMLGSAKVWAAHTIADWFRDHDAAERSFATELIGQVEDLVGDGPFVRQDLDLGCRVDIWAAPEAQA